MIIGRRWLKLLGAVPPLRHLRQAYVDRYPIALPDPTADADTERVAHPEVWSALQAVAGRRMDGYLLYRHVKDGGHASDGIPSPPPLQTQLDALGGRLHRQHLPRLRPHGAARLVGGE